MIRKRFIAYVLLTYIAFSCSGSQSDSNSKSMKKYIPTDLRKLKYNQKATLVGVYTKNIISQRGPGEHRGHYKIVVNDSLQVMLLPPYEKEAIRSKEEVQLFEGKKVMVTGIIKEITFAYDPYGDQEPPFIFTPNFSTIEDIRLAEEDSSEKK